MTSIETTWDAKGDPSRAFWRVYLSTDRLLKGRAIAEVDPDDSSYVIRNVLEGRHVVRALAVGKGGIEQDWLSAPYAEIVVSRRSTAPSSPTQAAAARVDSSSAISVTLTPPAATDPPQQVEIIRGADPDWGQLIGTHDSARGDPDSEGGERQALPPLTVGSGRGVGQEMYAIRGVVRGGRASGLPSTFRIPSVALPNYDATVIGSVVTGTLTGIYAPTSLEGWDHGTDGVGLRELPASGTMGTDSGWGTSGVGRYSLEPSGAYFTTVATMTISTYDLGTVRDPVVLECWDAAQRDSTQNILSAIESRRLNSMPSNPVEFGLDGSDLSPDWTMHRIRSDGSPFRPLPATRWQVQYGEAAVTESGWREYVPGMIVRARYLQARIVLTDPLGWFRTVMPFAYCRAWLPHATSEHSEVITSNAGADPLAGDLVELQGVAPLGTVDGAVFAVRAERGTTKIFVNVGGALQYVALTS